MIFLDTYPLVKMMEDKEYLRGYSDEEVVTLTTNLIELHQVMLRNYSEEVADHFAKKIAKITIPVPLDIIMPASKWRHKKSSNFSYADALGYQYSKKKGIPFITGDRDFEDVEKARVIR